MADETQPTGPGSIAPGYHSAVAPSKSQSLEIVLKDLGLTCNCPPKDFNNLEINGNALIKVKFPGRFVRTSHADGTTGDALP